MFTKFLLAVFFVFASQNANAFDSRASSLSLADKYLLENKFDDAEAAYRAMLCNDTTGDAHLGLSFALTGKNEIKKSIAVLKETKLLFPENAALLGTGGYLSYKYSRIETSASRRRKLRDAAHSLCRSALKERPDMLLPLFTEALLSTCEWTREKTILESDEISAYETSDSDLHRVFFPSDENDKPRTSVFAVQDFHKMTEQLVNHQFIKKYQIQKATQSLDKVCEVAYKSCAAKTLERQRKSADMHFAKVKEALRRGNVDEAEKEFRNFLDVLGITQLLYPQLSCPFGEVVKS